MSKPKSLFTHLTEGERIRISEMLCRGESFRAIAKELGKSTSTITREVKKHSIVVPTKVNDCLLKKDCVAKGVCNKPMCTRKLCKRCSIPCKFHCKDYIKAHCEILCNPPYVCNVCSKYNKYCGYERVIYRPELAHRAYSNTLIEKRQGFDLTTEQFETINSIASPLIKKGQSPYHIKQTFGDEIPVSESTLRRLVNRCELDARDIDLRDKVKRKSRAKKHPTMKREIITALKQGHLYTDYLEYMKGRDVTTVQMDCVEGIMEDKATILTLHFPQFHMQLAFIMDAHTSLCVVKTLDKVEEALGKDLFKEMFPVILTDNGHEFLDITNIERSIFGGKRTRLFFCEPNRSDEKGACENNHKLMRYIIPKGTSLNPFSQADITLMMNHINSYARKSLFGKSPYDIAMQVLPEDFFIFLGLEKIPPSEVILKPSLLKKS